jgi:hypothetical protein
VSAQDPAEVARFVGLPWTGRRLEVGDLLTRLEALLDVAAAFAERWPAQRLTDTLPGRDRSHADLLYHVAMIVEGLLDAADPERAGALTYAHFERRPPPGDVAPARLADRLRATGASLTRFRARGLPAGADVTVKTYYGERPVHELIERSAWHVAQHLRQIEHLAREVLRLRDVPEIGAALLTGLPLPERVWDAEIQFGARAALD